MPVYREVRSGDHKYTFRFGVRDINHPQQPTSKGAADRDPDTVLAGAILAGVGQYLFDFGFHNIELVDMGRPVSGSM